MRKVFLSDNHVEVDQLINEVADTEAETNEMLRKIAHYREEDLILGMNNRLKIKKINNWKEMNRQIGLANRVLPRILPLNCDITELNRLYYATGRAIADNMEGRSNRQPRSGGRKFRKPPWKYRLEMEILTLRKELSILTSFQKAEIKSIEVIRRAQNIIMRERTNRGNR